MIDLRDYQRDIVDRARRVRRPCIVMPTGSGKTLVASEIIRSAPDRHVLFLAHRRELIRQAAEKLGEFGVNAGVILAGEPTNAMCGVQVASVQTLWSRSFRSKSLELPPAEIVFIDEAHHVRARTYKAIIEKYPDAKIIGLTATPCRRDGRGLGNVFDALVEGPQVPELIAQGFLVGTKVFAPSKPDLKGVHTRQGDYVERELAERMDKIELVGDIVSHWHRLSERRKTVVFATSVAHSVHLKDEFERSGVRAEHIDGSTPKGERDEILAEFARGDLKVVTNCAVLTEGWDSPSVSCIVLARPTKSPGLFRQMVGRVLRPYPGKEHALVLDHAGAVFQHGFVEDPVIWTLDADKRTETPSQAARQLQPSSRLLECSQCSAIRTAGHACPHCGFLPRRPGQHIDVRDGDLVHVGRNGKPKPNEWTPELRHLFHRQLVGVAMQRGYKPGWAAHQYKSKFGHWPPHSNVEPMVPKPEVTSWVRSRQIAYAKAMQKAG